MLTTAPDVDTLSIIGRALADPTRCRILLRLLAAPAYPARLAVELGLSRPNVSNHLTCLREWGLVSSRSEGRQVRYELVDVRLAHALTDLVDLAGVLEVHER